MHLGDFVNIDFQLASQQIDLILNLFIGITWRHDLINIGKFSLNSDIIYIVTLIGYIHWFLKDLSSIPLANMLSIELYRL